MAKSKSIPKIALSVSRDIPLNKLVLSQANVRQVKAGVSIEELAEDIARRTLLQSLTVRAVLDEMGQETGAYEVPAGGRRFRALQLLVKQKRLAPTAPIPCVIRTEGIAEEDSLAENIQRAPLHPLDQFRAFKTLREKGKSEEEIAAAFFVSATVVRQRLKLAAVAPVLLDLYAEDELGLDQLMAFTVNPDHQRQIDAWGALKNGYARDAYHIRRLLTEGAVRAGDKRARFVGLEAYEAAGGSVLRDLFADADDGWLQDAGLLNRLVAEKLEKTAAELRAEGWKWVEAAADFPYGHTFGLRRIEGERAALTDEEQQSYDALKAEFEGLNAQYESAEELPEEVDQRLGELETAIETVEERPFRFPPEEVARAGVFVSLDPSGALRIDRGLVRPEDEEPVDETAASNEVDRDAADDDAARTAPSPEAGDDLEEADDETDRPIPDRLIVELTEWRTLALREALAHHPDIALLAALHALCLNLFHTHGGASCIDIAARQNALRSGAAGLADCAAAIAIDARHQAFSAQLPEQPDALWEALSQMDAAARAALFAHCVGLTVDAVFKPYDRKSRAPAHADIVACAIGLDMRAAGWKPTAGGYFVRITKAQILNAVREAKGDDAAERLAALKKPDMAAAAEELLAASSWLPPVLRLRPRDEEPQSGGGPDGDHPLADELRRAPAESGELPASPAIAAE